VRMWEAFADACLGKSEVPVPVESVLKTMKLLDAARESSTRGCVVPIDW
jgi:predicted dehydrogenase